MVTLEQAKIVSSAFSITSTVCWVVASLPQQLENYSTKSAAGLSSSFLLLWLSGDLLNLIGCILTDQLPFQVYLSLYFLFNDLVLNTQYHYYGTAAPCPDPLLADPLLAHSPQFYAATAPLCSPRSMAQSPRSMAQSPRSIAATVLSVATLTDARPLPNLPSPPHVHSRSLAALGPAVAWSCTCLYATSRLPQLYKNYKRKSVDGISPLLFAFALIANFTYTCSILTSSRMFLAPDKWAYVHQELPYILGSAGTIIFDLFYFYQRWLYGHDQASYLIIDD